MTALAGYKADMYVAQMPSIALTNEAFTDSGDHKTYTITNAAKRFIDRGVAVVVQVSTDGGGTYHAAPAYTLQYCGAVIVFDVANAVGTLVRIQSGSYLAVSQLGQAFEWKADISADVIDVSNFGSAWRSKIQGEKEGSGSAARYWLDGAMFTNVLNGSPVVFVLYTNYAAGSRYEAYGYIDKDSIDTPTGGVVAEDLTFDLDGQVYYYAS